MRDKLGRFKKGHIPWHKGKHLPTWYKKILSKAKKGKKLSKEICDKMSERFKGENNPFYGKKHSRKTKIKISKAKRGKFKGENSWMWKGGKIINSQGYVLIYSPNHPFINSRGYIREHHLVMEKYIGRYLKPEEVVHHINGILDDNRIENLKLFPNQSKHRKYHHPKISI